MTPILVIVMGVQPSVAIGTDLLYAAITKVVGALQHWQLKTIDLKIATSLAAGSIPAVLVGTLLVKSMTDSLGSSAEGVLSQILGARADSSRARRYYRRQHGKPKGTRRTRGEVV